MTTRHDAATLLGHAASRETVPNSLSILRRPAETEVDPAFHAPRSSMRRSYPMSDGFSPGPQRIAEAAARKGVTLDVRLMQAPALCPQEVAAEFDVDLGQIVQSLVCVAPRLGNALIPIVCLVPAGCTLDLDLVAAVTGEVAASMATSRQAHELLGYSPATMPPFGHGREVRTVMDRDLGGYRWVWAAAGAESAILRISPGTLRMLANAVVAPIASSRGTPLGVPLGLRTLLPLTARGIA